MQVPIGFVTSHGKTGLGVFKLALGFFVFVFLLNQTGTRFLGSVLVLWKVLENGIFLLLLRSCLLS